MVHSVWTCESELHNPISACCIKLVTPAHPPSFLPSPSSPLSSLLPTLLSHLSFHPHPLLSVLSSFIPPSSFFPHPLPPPSPPLSSLTPFPPSSLSPYQIQLLLWLMESKVVKDAIDGLIMARPSQALGKDIAPMTKEMKRMSLRRKASLAAGGKCTCGKCTKCIPSPSGMFE